MVFITLCSFYKGTYMNFSSKKSAALRKALVAVMVSGLMAGSAVQAKWSFGVIADNQDVTGGTHGLVATQTIHQIDAQFIAKGVKLVIQVGDQLNTGAAGNLSFAAAEAQFLYENNIGFFPMRGNHEAQASGGKSTATIDMFLNNFPQTRGLANIFGESHFSSPSIAHDSLNGLSYSFDYFGDNASARFLVIDDWGTVKATNRYNTRLGASYPLGYSVGEQQEWISEQLNKDSRGTDHAFVFAHHNIIGAFHWDCLFGYSNDALDQQNAFYASLFNNGVRYYTSGHEHLYNRSLMTSPDGNNWIQDINCASAGPKFINPTDTGAWLPAAPIGPAPTANTIKYFFGQKSRQTQIAQELNNIGFYIYTIDGPQVTVDYYSDATGGFKTWPDGATPTFNFIKKETFGYCLNGKEFRVAQGQPYTGIADKFAGTSAKILSGVNSCTDKDLDGPVVAGLPTRCRPFTKVINTGWTGKTGTLRSDILTIWGMPNFGTPNITDVFTLSMTYDPSTMGACALMSQKDDGTWEHAATGKFVAGPFNPSYGLGTYGIDFATKTVWAVVNHASNFAVQASVDGDQNGDGVVDNADVNIVIANRNKLASEAPLSDLDNDGKVTVLDARKIVLLRTVQ
jgi:hypothetical protein